MITCVFNCSSVKQTFSYEKCINLIDSNYPDSYLDTEICGRIYYDISEDMELAFRMVRKKWSYLQNAVLHDLIIPLADLTEVRDTVNKCLKLILLSLKYSESEEHKKRLLNEIKNHIGTFAPLILSLADLEKEIFSKLINPTCSRERCPIYHYFHTFQDIQYYLLMLNYVSGNIAELINQIGPILKDLIIFSESGYKQNSKSVFVCDCHKHFWLFLQILCEESLGKNAFWKMFNGLCEHFESDYVLWLLKEIADLQAFDLNCKYVGPSSNRIEPNFTLLETALRNSMLKGGINILRLVEPLICNLWLKWTKIEIYQIMWDFFGKNINSCSRKVTNLTLLELMELIDIILWKPKDSEVDFELFLSMLLRHLIEHPYHWAKIKGRIYSQLGPNKLRDLNNGGLFNVLLLYLCLTKISFDELAKKFLALINNLPPEKKQSQMVWTFYSSFLIRHLQENRDIECAVPQFIKMLEQASMDHKYFYLIKIFVNDFELLIKSSSNLQLHQWLLINSWSHKYIGSCNYPDLVHLLNVLSNTIDRINQESVWYDWEDSFKNNVYTALKYSRNTPEISGAITGKIALLSPSLLTDAFTFFNNDTISIKISAKFLCVVLENYPNSVSLTAQQEITALQSWMKFCLLSRDSHEDLTRCITSLDIIPEFSKISLRSAKDPLSTFVDCIGTDNKQQSKSESTMKLCEIFCYQTEKTIAQYFTSPENELVVLRIFNCLAQAFLKIGPLVYDKHKSNCPFARLVASILLPSEIIMGKPLNQFILNSIRKTWHLFFEAIVNLNSGNDAFLERIGREMIVRYISYFPSAESPMMKILQHEAMAGFFLEKLADGFFKQSTKELDSNVFKALRLINDFVQSTTSLVLLKLVVTKCLFGIFEIKMFHNQRGLATSIVTNILSSPLSVHISKEIQSAIILVTEKHIAFNTPNYFQLLTILVKMSPNNVRSAIPGIKQILCNVERMRGVGYDKSLRLNMERLEASLSKLI